MHIRQAHGFYNWFRRPQLVLGSFSDDSHDFLPLPAKHAAVVVPDTRGINEKASAAKLLINLA